MNIPETAKKLKQLLDGDLFIFLAFILACSLSFSFGYLAGREEKALPVSIDTSAAVYKATSEEKNFVASVSGTKYYLPYCSGVSRIKEENKIWFADKEDAELAGYTPAANCF
ncbi:MAG: hypothetical protein ACJKSS_02255 [Patescibacteria group bacterium UBA2103]